MNWLGRALRLTTGMQANPTHGEDVKRLVADMAPSDAGWNTDCIVSNEHHAGVSDRDLSHEGGHGHQHELGTAGAAKGSKRYGKSDFLEHLKPGHAPAYATARGEAWVGDSRALLKKIRDESIDLVVTSPPYGLLKKKEYGNEDQND